MILKYQHRFKNLYNKTMPLRIKIILTLGFLTLIAERLVASFWICGLIILLGIASLYLELPSLIDIAVFTGFFVCAIIAFIRGLKTFSWPIKKDVLRRAEIDSDLLHRPATSYEDENILSHNEPSLRLWNQHKINALKHFFNLKLTTPRSVLTPKDPYALRFLIIGLFLLAFVVGGFHFPNSPFAEIIQPDWFKNKNAANRLYFKPPEYTRTLPISLTNQNTEQTVRVPEKSVLNALVYGKHLAPSITLNDETTKLTKTDQDVFSIEKSIPPGLETITLDRWFLKPLTWAIETLPDNAPTLSQDGAVETLPDGMIRVPMIAFDDYGIETLTITMDIDADIDVPPIGKATTETRSIMSPPDEPFEFAPVLDYTAHPWAGLPVKIDIAGTDHLGQSSSIDTIHMVLPEKPFRHPIAKDLIEMRKKLAWNFTDTDVAMIRTLLTFLGNPDKFGHDPVVFLGLRTAASRLQWSDPSKDRSEKLIALLWDLAVTIEDGDLRLAAQKLRTAQNNLDQTMRNPDATQDEIDQAMNDLRGAMQSYLNELAQEMMKDGAPMLSPDMFDQIISPESLDSFMDEIEKALRDGDKQKAQGLMAELQSMMDRMQPGMSGQMQMPPDMKMMQRGINELQELVKRQEALRAQTAGQAGEIDFGDALPFDDDILNELGMNDMPPLPSSDLPRPQGTVNTTKNKTEQEALRYILGQLMLDASEELDEIPETMGLAEQEMRGSSSALGENDPSASLPHQDKAIEYLKQAQKSLSDQLGKRMKQMGGMAMGVGPGGMKQDPMGRPYSEGDEDRNGFPGSPVEIPDEAELKRAYEILKELRNRSADRTRAREELEYFKRLLRQF